MYVDIKLVWLVSLLYNYLYNSTCFIQVLYVVCDFFPFFADPDLARGLQKGPKDLVLGHPGNLQKNLDPSPDLHIDHTRNLRRANTSELSITFFCNFGFVPCLKQTEEYHSWLFFECTYIHYEYSTPVNLCAFLYMKEFDFYSALASSTPKVPVCRLCKDRPLYVRFLMRILVCLFHQQ